MVLVRPGTQKAYKSFLCSLYVLTPEEGGRHTGFHGNYKPQMFVRSADVSCVLNFTEDSKVDTVMPGDNVELKCDLLYPMAIEKGQRFTFREG